MSSTTDANLAVWIDSLDPTLREAARGYLHDLMKPILPSSSLTHPEYDLRDRLQQRIKYLSSADAPIPIPVVVMVTFFASFVALRTAPFLVVLTILMMGFFAGLWSFAQRENRKVSNENATKAVFDSALRAVLPHVAPTRTERAYCDAVGELFPAQSGTEDYLSSELRREQMLQLNALLDSGRRLDAVRGEIASALAAATPETLRAEADALRQRQERATDPGTRNAFAQSLALCEERLRRVESLSGLTERIEAEQELVYQAFRAAQSSINSLRVSPTTAGLDSEFGQTSVTEVAETIGRQTRAVEKAVQELGIRH